MELPGRLDFLCCWLMQLRVFLGARSEDTKFSLWFDMSVKKLLSCDHNIDTQEWIELLKPGCKISEPSNRLLSSCNGSSLRAHGEVVLAEPLGRGGLVLHRRLPLRYESKLVSLCACLSERYNLGREPLSIDVRSDQ